MFDLVCCGRIGGKHIHPGELQAAEQIARFNLSASTAREGVVTIGDRLWQAQNTSAAIRCRLCPFRFRQSIYRTYTGVFIIRGMSVFTEVGRAVDLVEFSTVNTQSWSVCGHSVRVATLHDQTRPSPTRRNVEVTLPPMFFLFRQCNTVLS